MNPWEKYSKPETTETVDSSGPWSKYGTSESTFTQANFQDSSAPVEEKKGIIKSIISPIEDAGIEVLRGAEQSMAGTLGKLDALASLVRNKTGLDISDGLDVAEKYWQQQASSLPETDLPFKGVYNFIGSTPVVLAEFAGTGGVGSMAIRAGILSGLEDYNKEATDASLVKGAVRGAAIVGATAGALNIAGKGLQVAAKALENYGPSAAKAVLKMSMPKGSTTEDLNMAYQKLEELTSPKYRKNVGGTTPELEVQAKNEIEALKKKLDDETYIEKKKVNNEQAYREMDAKKIFEQASDDYKMAKQALDSNNSEIITQATAKYSESVLVNKQNALDEVRGLVDGLSQKALLLRQQESKLVANGIKAISKKTPGVGVALNEFLIPNIEKTFKAIVKDNPEVMSLSRKGGSLSLVPTRKEFSEVVQRLNGEIQSLKEEFGKSRIVPLNILQGGKEVYSTLAAKAIKNEDNLGARIYSEMSKAFNPVNYAEVATGGREALKALAEANKSFSSKADSYELLKSAFLLKNGGSVDTLLRSLKGDTEIKKSFIRKLETAEKILPENDRIISKIRDIAARTEKADNQYLDILNKTKKYVQNQERDLLRNHTEAIRRLRDNQGRLSIQEKDALRDTIRGINLQEADKLSAMKKALDAKINESRIVDSLQSLRQNDEASILRIMQNFGAYGVIGKVLSGDVLGATIPASISLALSPKVLTGTAKNLKYLSTNYPSKLSTLGKKIESITDVTKTSYALSEKK